MKYPDKEEVRHEITQRLDEFRLNKGYVSVRSFGKTLRGVTITQYYSLHPKSKRVIQPSTDVLRAVAEAFPDLNLSWLLLGQGEMLYDLNSPFMHTQQPDYLEMLTRAMLRAEALSKELEQKARDAEAIETELRRIKEASTPRLPDHKGHGKGRHDTGDAGDGSRDEGPRK